MMGLWNDWRVCAGGRSGLEASGNAGRACSPAARQPWSALMF